MATMIIRKHNIKKAILGTGRPLTIACHIKKTYFFFAESALALIVSMAALAVESMVDFAESEIAFTVSAAALAVESVVASELERAIEEYLKPGAVAST